MSSKCCSSGSGSRPELVVGPEMVEKAWCGWVGLLLRIGHVWVVPIGKLDGCSSVFDEGTEVWVHESAVRDSSRR